MVEKIRVQKRNFSDTGLLDVFSMDFEKILVRCGLEGVCSKSTTINCITKRQVLRDFDCIAGQSTDVFVVSFMRISH